MPDFRAKATPHLEALLEPGEALLGVCAATQQSTFRGRLFAIGITDRRLILLPLDRRIEPAGETHSLRPEDLADARMGGGAGGWLTPSAAIVDAAAARLELKTTGGQRFKLVMMRSGDAGQREGMLALGHWFEAR